MNLRKKIIILKYYTTVQRLQTIQNSQKIRSVTIQRAFTANHHIYMYSGFYHGWFDCVFEMQLSTPEINTCVLRFMQVTLASKNDSEAHCVFILVEWGKIPNEIMIVFLICRVKLLSVIQSCITGGCQTAIGVLTTWICCLA